MIRLAAVTGISLLLTGCLNIGPNTIVRNAIIDKDARVGSNVVLDPAGKPDHFEGSGLFIRDGVLIVPKNTIIPDNTVFAEGVTK